MTPVCIMCGGRGERLHGLTQHTPKPMLEVGDKPMIQTIIEDFRDQGFKRFTLCVHYKAELIENHFGNGERFGVKIKYTHETEPMGTGGALHLINRPDVPFIVQNADVLTHVRYGHLMSHHVQSGRPATMALALHQYQIPYGVARLKNGHVATIDEKPIENWYVNAGIYVLDPSALYDMPEGPFDMTDLLGRLSAVAHYPIHDYWCDLGRWEDLVQAREEWPGT